MLLSRHTRRREFITLVGGAAAAWPGAARAQQADRVRRVGVLMAHAENDSAPKTYLAAFTQELAKLGWTDGGNLRLVIRWTASDPDQTSILAKELVDLRLDVILANTSPVTAALQRETRTIPLVFVVVADPVGQGFVASLSRPGGNITGFVFVESTMMGKWFELLTQIAPAVKRVAIMYNPDTAPARGAFFLPKFVEAAGPLKTEATTVYVRNDAEIEAVMTSLAQKPGSGVAVMPDIFTYVHRVSILSLAARNNVPTVYWDKRFVKEGGLLSYGTDQADLFRRSASYVDRILRGEKAAELPVQLPVKFEMAVNAHTAKALGLTIPDSILVRADEVIE
jgi:putative tryptophan/tyrosine transport system substrate-binding protein